MGEINRWSIEYWINGAGFWADRFHCASYDLLLASSSIIFACILFFLYVAYAIYTNEAISLVKNKLFKKHLQELRTVFITCGFIHILNSVLFWFYPMYWVIVFVMIFNIYNMHKLLIYKRDLLKIQENVDHCRKEYMAVKEKADNVRCNSG